MKTVPLHGKKAAGRVVKVDDGDYEIVMQYRWHVKEEWRSDRVRPTGPYARANIRVAGRRTTIEMHAMLTGWPRTDHVNHDGLDNRRSNLRPASYSQNGANQRRQQPGKKSSRFKGVCWVPPGPGVGKQGRWLARIEVHGVRRHIGKFAHEEDAARAYDAAARKLFGDYACPNFPDESTL